MLAVVIAAVATYLLAGYPYGPVQLCMVFAMFEAARLRPLHTSLLACGAAVAAATGALLIRAGQDAAKPLLLAIVWASWLVVPWSVGALVRIRSAAIERSRQELAARSALEERIRVAREVHDVAGHGFAAVAMQAGVALLVLDEQPEQVKASLEAIQSTSTKALTELRTMLDADRRGGGAADATHGLRDVTELVEHVRAAGVPVRLSRDAGGQSADLSVTEAAGTSAAGSASDRTRSPVPGPAGPAGLPR